MYVFAFQFTGEFLPVRVVVQVAADVVQGVADILPEVQQAAAVIVVKFLFVTVYRIVIA